METTPAPSLDVHKPGHTPPAERLLQGAEFPDFMAGERRLGTALWANVHESEALLDELGPEAWAETLRDVGRILEARVIEFGGQVLERWPEGLLALFGLPVTHEDDPERAVLAALAVQAALARREGAEVEVRIGVDTAEILVTLEQDRVQVTGRALTLARRAGVAAVPGTIQVGDNAYRLVRSLFEWSISQGRTQRLHRPRARKASPAMGRGLPGFSSPLVGREPELGALADNHGRAGIILAGAGDWQSALHRYQKAQEIWLQIEDARHQGINLVLLSQAYLVLGDLDRAAEYAARALRTTEPLQTHYHLAAGHWLAGLVALCRHDWPAALDALREAADLEPGLLLQAPIYHALGRAHLALGQQKEAQVHLLYAVGLLDRAIYPGAYPDGTAIRFEGRCIPVTRCRRQTCQIEAPVELAQ